MRSLITFGLLLVHTLFGAPADISTFHSKFEQTIVDERGKMIRYSGELWAGKPQNALWVYQKPIQKSVYITGQKLTVVEPQIEQVTLRSLENDIDFLQIIQKAKKIDNDRYSANVRGQLYTIVFKNGLLTQISYTDTYDNRVTITFTSPSQNSPIEPSRFKPMIPADYDVIRG